MKDQLLLLVTGIAGAAFAALFFHITGKYSTWGLGIGFFITVVAYFKKKRRERNDQ
jgi:uncharacterized membrane protein YgaE (UPF0421/DUF939 family)